MRVLLDECVPRKLRSELPGHEVRTVPEMGWSGLKDRPLLDRAQPHFDVFLTVDQGIRYQQNLAGWDIAALVLEAPSNDIDDLQPLMVRARELLGSLGPGQVVVLKS